MTPPSQPLISRVIAVAVATTIAFSACSTATESDISAPTSTSAAASTVLPVTAADAAAAQAERERLAALPGLRFAVRLGEGAELVVSPASVAQLCPTELRISTIETEQSIEIYVEEGDALTEDAPGNTVYQDCSDTLDESPLSMTISLEAPLRTRELRDGYADVPVAVIDVRVAAPPGWSPLEGAELGAPGPDPVWVQEFVSDANASVQVAVFEGPGAWRPLLSLPPNDSIPVTISGRTAHVWRSTAAGAFIFVEANPPITFNALTENYAALSDFIEAVLAP